MTALARDRNTRVKSIGRTASRKVNAASVIFKGGIVVIDADGYARPGVDTTGFRFGGIADHAITGGASDGDERVRVLMGSVVELENASAGNALVQADIGRAVALYDDQTVGKIAGSAGRVIVGVLEQFDPESGKPWIKLFDEVPDIDTEEGVGIETVTSGALSLDVRTSLVSVTGTQAYTLANGEYEGQRKTIRVTVAASTPDGTLTPATFADGTSIDLDAVNESVELEWHATGGWRVVSIVGATIT